MARQSRWRKLGVTHGIGEIRLFSWRYFNDFVDQEMLDFRHYVWRGHRCDNWLLEPTLDRYLKRHPTKWHPFLRKKHIENFKYAVRGRRGPNPSILQTENDWWALGQHHGLASPLLDWTSSPYAAAYFAFWPEGTDQTEDRAIYAVHPNSLTKKSDEIAKKYKGKGRAPIIEFVRPLADDNPRLVNQAGVFTRAPDGVGLESWIGQHFGESDIAYTLMKMTIPNRDRDLALRSLNRMNINHLTLFPDIYGAAKFCNLDLEIEKY